MRIAIASDHAGFQYKSDIKAFLSSKGYDVRDFGCYSDAAADYPQFIRPAAQAVANGDCAKGIVLCRCATATSSEERISE